MRNDIHNLNKCIVDYVHVLRSDAIGLQQQLEELQIRLVTLEKKTGDYESLQAELEEKKVCSFFGECNLHSICFLNLFAHIVVLFVCRVWYSLFIFFKVALKTFGQISEEMEKLKQENIKMMAE